MFYFFLFFFFFFFFNKCNFINYTTIIHYYPCYLQFPISHMVFFFQDSQETILLELYLFVLSILRLPIMKKNQQLLKLYQQLYSNNGLLKLNRQLSLSQEIQAMLYMKNRIQFQ
eukprot:TRINITY_DN11605_c0_g1_i1.p3 TRINITY_DN11605_c0_g1~~TRINITY_DN11605_c0_g1_i1.p3  ORF type:complete len:114 (+),score=20.19 TRINITY_DN11605_c0_g1_i1:44-385(+)